MMILKIFPKKKDTKTLEDESEGSVDSEGSISAYVMLISF
jgi:hypothetical protein